MSRERRFQRYASVERAKLTLPLRSGYGCFTFTAPVGIGFLREIRTLEIHT